MMLGEARLRTDITKKARGFANKKFLNKRIEDVQKHFNKTASTKLKHHSTMADGRHVFSGVDHDLHHHFFTTSPEGKIDSSVTAIKRGKALDIDMAVANPGTGVHKLYHHLITKHNQILTSKEQSPGGLAVWQKMRKMGGVNVHGYHKGTGKGEAIDITKHPEFSHVTDKELHQQLKTKGGTAQQRKAEYAHLKKQQSMHLVAHKDKNKRPLKEGRAAIVLGTIKESLEKY